MEGLPSELIGNILIIKYESQIKELKRKIAELEEKSSNMLNYVESHDVKYCEQCGEYGDDDEIMLGRDDDAYLCESCKEWQEQQELQNPNHCFACEKGFDLNAYMNPQDCSVDGPGLKIRAAYDKYFGSESDDGDICPECLLRGED
jgi:hypothetical protein